MKYLLDHTKYVNKWILDKESCVQLNVYYTTKKELLGANVDKLGKLFELNVSGKYADDIANSDNSIYDVKREFSEAKFSKLVDDYNKETNNKYIKFKSDLFKAYEVIPEKAEKLFSKAVQNVGAISKTNEIEEYFAEYVDLVI